MCWIKKTFSDWGLELITLKLELQRKYCNNQTCMIISLINWLQCNWDQHHMFCFFSENRKNGTSFEQTRGLNRRKGQDYCNNIYPVCFVSLGTILSHVALALAITLVNRGRLHCLFFSNCRQKLFHHAQLAVSCAAVKSGFYEEEAARQRGRWTENSNNNWLVWWRMPQV